MKKTSRRLSLNRETVLHLTSEQLARTGGGNMDAPNGSVYECATGHCPSNVPTYCLSCYCTPAVSRLMC